LIWIPLLHNVVEPAPSLLSNVNQGLSLEVKRPWRESNHSLPSSAEVKEGMEIYIYSPNTPSWRGAQLKHRDNFYFNVMTKTLRQNYSVVKHINVRL
jgi:hypothetical protein